MVSAVRAMVLGNPAELARVTQGVICDRQRGVARRKLEAMQPSESEGFKR